MREVHHQSAVELLLRWWRRLDWICTNTEDEESCVRESQSIFKRVFPDFIHGGGGCFGVGGVSRHMIEEGISANEIMLAFDADEYGDTCLVVERVVMQVVVFDRGGQCETCQCCGAIATTE